MGEYEAYATNDLFVRHPSKPGLWKIQGRADDQLMLSTGEKVFLFPRMLESHCKHNFQTNPGPLGNLFSPSPILRVEDRSRENTASGSPHSRSRDVWQRAIPKWHLGRSRERSFL